MKSVYIYLAIIGLLAGFLFGAIIDNLNTNPKIVTVYKTAVVYLPTPNPEVSPEKAEKSVVDPKGTPVQFFAHCKLVETKHHSDSNGSRYEATFHSGNDLLNDYPSIFVTVTDKINNEFSIDEIDTDYALALYRVKK